MTTVKTIALALALVLGAAPAALAQSAYTTGSVAGNLAAGYASPYGAGAVYNSASGFGGHVAVRSGRNAYASIRHFRSE